MDSVLLRLTARNIKTLYMQFLVVTAAIPFCLPPSHLAKLGEGWGSDWHAVCLPVYPAASNTVMSNEIKSNLLKHKDRMAPYNARSTDNNEQHIYKNMKGLDRNNKSGDVKKQYNITPTYKKYVIRNEKK